MFRLEALVWICFFYLMMHSFAGNPFSKSKSVGCEGWKESNKFAGGFCCFFIQPGWVGRSEKSKKKFLVWYFCPVFWRDGWGGTPKKKIPEATNTKGACASRSSRLWGSNGTGVFWHVLAHHSFYLHYLILPWLLPTSLYVHTIYILLFY